MTLKIINQKTTDKKKQGTDKKTKRSRQKEAGTEGIQKHDTRWELSYFLDRFDLSLKFSTEFSTEF